MRLTTHRNKTINMHCRYLGFLLSFCPCNSIFRMTYHYRPRSLLRCACIRVNYVICFRILELSTKTQERNWRTMTSVSSNAVKLIAYGKWNASVSIPGAQSKRTMNESDRKRSRNVDQVSERSRQDLLHDQGVVPSTQYARKIWNATRQRRA